MSRNNKLVFWALLLWGFGEGLWWYLLPLYIGSLGADSVQIGFVLFAAMILMTVSFIPAGWLGDRVSRKLVMVAGWAMGFVSILGLAVARTWQEALPALVLYNLSGFCMPVINTYVTAEVPSGQDLRRSFTLVFTGFTLGTVLSPTVGGWLADVWGLRQVVFLSAFFFALSAAIILLVKDQPLHRPATGALHVSLGRNRLFMSLCALFFVVMLAAHVGVPLAPNFLQEERHLPMSTIGVLGSLNGIGGVVLTFGLGRWPKGRVVGLLIAEAAVAVYAVLLLTSSSVAVLGLAVFLRSGVGAIRHLAGARMGEILPPASMGLGYGVFQTVVNLAMTVSPYLAGWLYAFDPSYPFVANAVLLIPAMVLTAAIAGQGSVRPQAGVSSA